MSAVDCTTCGACCSSYDVIDVMALDPVPLHMVREDREHGTIMRRKNGRCIALTGKIGCNASCSIYEERPQVCRDFEAGGDRCMAVRRRFGFEPPLPTPPWATRQIA